MKRILIVVVVAGLAWPPTAAAQSTVVEEIIVMARKVEESLQDVPVSIVVMGGDKMSEAGITKIEELVPYLPNFAMSETGIGTNLYVRGIGSGINQGFEQSVGMYIDGVYYGRAQLIRAPFLDLAQAEALRGPQVTLLGNNSIAGALILRTAKPSDEFETSLNLLAGEDDEREVTGVISGPLFGQLSARLAGRYRTLGGYLKNNILGRDEPDRTETSGRLTLLWSADNWDATLKLERNEFNVKGRQIEIIRDDPSVTRGSSPTGFSNNTGSSALWQPGFTYLQYLGQFFDPDPRIQNGEQDFVRGSNGDRSDNTVNAVVGTINIDIGEHTLTAVSGYLEYEYSELCDCDFTGADQFQLLSEEDYWQFSQELRLTSPQDRRLRYMVGLYYQQDELDFGDQIFLPIGSGVAKLVGYATTGDPNGANASIGNTSAFRDFRQNAWNSAIFGQLSFDITDRWRGELGLRFAKIEKEAVRILQEGDLSRRPFDLTDPNDFARLSTGAVLYSSIFQAAFHQLGGSREEDQWSFELVSEFDLTDDVMLYGSVKKGNKSGGFDVRSNSEPDPGTTGAGVLYPASLQATVANNVKPGSFEFEDEKALAFELGSKLVLAGGAADLSVALFRTEYENLQVSIFDGTLGFNVGNAAEATTQGVELDGRWRINDNWMLNGSLAYLDFEFDKFPNGQCNQGQPPDTPDGNCDYSGKTNQYVAPWSGSFSLNYERQLGELLFRGTFDLLFTDSYHPSQNLDPRVKQDAYAKLNLRLAIGDPDGRWELAVLGRNLTDETIVTYANDTPLAFSQFGSPSWYGFLDRPRSFAVQGFLRFP
ncbi:MAG: TonB-dependent receptor [Gammaproteobacteria bacterium]|nr:MAG: TonB-dependent receptor [Gammaproteobacteria bacterium]